MDNPMTHGIIHGFQVQARCAAEQRQQLILDAAGRDMSNEAMVTGPVVPCFFCCAP